MSAANIWPVGKERRRITSISKKARNGWFKILNVVDSFEQALKFQPEELKNSEWAKGVLQIKNQLDDFLKSRGVEAIKTLNEKFNPEFHEAIEAIISDAEEGMIVEEVQKGYALHGKVIRPARVKISK
ncbi:MAG: Protein GrpE [Candidatus Azambacteria bacterium GW2011_GWB1_46_27]|uniref:Protein GrpE n=1 Tax=Candidatus Azambacteria bacterium GW2011_GWB1_46_27 TaxID=1618617 RepID=A0A0G1RWR5_9BACT|nr:MAG: Protein GrpE [Candidatus Azambacteria bacterium GW2011_GWB1_46_27]